MPYSLSNNHSDCSGWAVVKDDDGSMVPGGCHATEAEAQSHLTALNIAEFGDRQAEPGGGVLPDGYRPAVSEDVPEGRACGNCRFYNEDRIRDGVEVWCDLWAAWVRGDHYCDRWEAAEEDASYKIKKKTRTETRQVDTSPPDYIRTAAARGLQLRADGFGGAGLTDKTIREARDMAAGRVSEDKVIRANAWAARHAVDLQAPQNSNADHEGWPGAGAVAHYLWGINPLNPEPARQWFERKSEQIKGERNERPPMKRDQLRGVRETRQWGLSGVELREQADGTVTFSGYASVYDRGYSVFDQFGEYTETIAPGAFDRTLSEAPDVVLVVNHEGLPLARTKSGTLQLSADSVGLRVEAQLDRSDPDVQALLPKFRRGDVDEMSFAFRVNGQEWSEDYSQRTITEISLSRGDVSIVTFGANPHTLAMVRAALQNDQVREQLLAVSDEAARVLTKGNAAPLIADVSENDDAPAEEPVVVEPASEPEPVEEEPAEEKPAAKKSPAKKRSVVDVAPIDMEALSADVAVDNIEGDSAQWFAENYRRLVALKSR